MPIMTPVFLGTRRCRCVAGCGQSGGPSLAGRFPCRALQRRRRRHPTPGPPHAVPESVAPATQKNFGILWGFCGDFVGTGVFSLSLDLPLCPCPPLPHARPSGLPAGHHNTKIFEKYTKCVRFAGLESRIVLPGPLPAAPGVCHEKTR